MRKMIVLMDDTRLGVIGAEAGRNPNTLVATFYENGKLIFSESAK